jgi:hypothetical protein
MAGRATFTRSSGGADLLIVTLPEGAVASGAPLDESLGQPDGHVP